MTHHGPRVVLSIALAAVAAWLLAASAATAADPLRILSRHLRQARGVIERIQVKLDRLPQSVNCCSCRQRIEVGANRGRRVPCPGCGTVQVMPS